MECDASFAKLSVSQSGSGPITPASRLGAALIMSGGGRSMEAMRTHGLSRATVHCYCHRVINAINNNPALDIVCDKSPPELQRRATQFMDRITNDIFKYCTGAIDGFAIHIVVLYCTYSTYVPYSLSPYRILNPDTASAYTSFLRHIVISPLYS